MGLLFVIVGNYLPKVKPNRTIGIRVVWALQDEENWNATHRFSGKIWVAAGLLSMICGLFSDSMAALFLFIVAITAAAFGSILYSYLYYRKKLRTGKGLAVHYNHKVVAVYVFIMLACVLFTVWTLLKSRPINRSSVSIIMMPYIRPRKKNIVQLSRK